MKRVIMLLIIFLIGLISIVFSVVMALWVMKQPAGTEKMQSIAAAIEEGAKAYMKRQYKTVAVFSVIVAALLWIFLGVNGAVTFILGAFLSALAGYAGMSVAVKANVRTA
ncbi:MAG: sodium/proton-translocating pyrophosphatase, partial [Candidatus Aenigmatarchaeota archaeon]